MKITWLKSRAQRAAAIVVAALVGIACLRPSAEVMRFGEPTMAGRDYEVEFSNQTDRVIQYRRLGFQMKCNGMWVGHLPVAGQARTDSLRSVQNFGFQTTPPSTSALAAKRGANFRGRLPLHVETPPEATAWRVGIEWSYAEPSMAQRWISAMMRFVSGGKLSWDLPAHQAFSREVPL